MKTLLLWLGLISLSVCAQSQQVAKTLTGANGQKIGFLQFTPPDYGSQKHPLIIFLHGIGERGDGTTQIQNVTANAIPNYCAHGATMRFTVNGQTSSFVVLSPQLSTAYGTWPSFYVQEMINYAKANLQIDPNRIYVTGLSLGGGGVWVYSYESYNNAIQIAAAAPVCGTDDGNDPNACNSAGAANLPIWAFHCKDDGTVGYGNTQHQQFVLQPCTSLTTLPRFTYYLSGGHSGAWINAFDTGHIVRAVDSSLMVQGASTNINFTAKPNLYEWFLMHTRSASAPQVVAVGSDMSVTLPVATVSLNGSGSYVSSGSITSYLWTFVSGPATPIIATPTLPVSVVASLVAGVYKFQLAVTSNTGAVATTIVTVTVNGLTNQTPSSNAGADQTITLPNSSVNLDGSASKDPDGSLISYAWSEVSGPSTATIANAGAATTSVSNLLAGNYKFQLTVTDAARATSTSTVNVTVNPAPTAGSGNGTGLQGDYYNTVDLTGAITFTRTDPTVNFNWAGSPGNGVGSDFFSVRWTGQVLPQYNETYTFYTTSDDGIRIWVNGQQIINDWTLHPATEDYGTIALKAGVKYNIVVEYFENQYSAVAALSWSSPSTPKSIIPQSQLFPPGTVTPPPPPPGGGGTGTGLQGDYYNTIDLSGAITATRTDVTVNFNWSTAPVNGLGANFFSVRWSGQVLPQYSETYTFYTTSDDGIRIWVNGQQLINNWTYHGPTENSGTIALTAGVKYNIVVEYFQNTASAVATLSWSSPSTPKAIIPQSQLFPPGTVTPPPGGGGTGTGLKGDYYNTMDLSGGITATRTDATVNFNWSTAPVNGLGANFFSVRWSGQVLPQYSETYTFYTTSDDGIRIWVNGQQLINNWTYHGPTENSGTIALTAGVKYNIVVEYFQNTASAVAMLSWSSPSTPKAVIPQSQLFPAGGTTVVVPTTGVGLEGDYYNTMDLSGAVTATRTDATVNFNWTGAPITGLGVNFFSVRWSGQVLPQYSETYTFYTTSDDGIRIWVNGQQLINNWTYHGPTENSGTIALTAGVKYVIVVEYFQNTASAVATLSWSSPSTPKAIIPQSQLFLPATATATSASRSAVSGTVTMETAPVITVKNGIVPNLVMASQQVRLNYNSAKAVPGTIQVVNTSGAVVYTKQVNLTAGLNIQSLSTDRLARGFYIVTILSDGKRETYKLVVQ